MNILLVVGLSAAGGLGAALRLVVDGLLRARMRMSYPLGTTVINITGSFLLGVLTGVAVGHALPEAWRTVIGVGFLGGYTTFSTASFETVRLAQDGRYLAAFTNGIGMLAGALLAAGLGLWLGSAF